MVAASTRWSVCAGIYAFLAGVALLLPLGIVADTLLKVIGIRSGSAAILLPASAGVIGTLVWWAVVERQGRYTYWRGGAVGVLTAGSTVAVWAGIVAIVYGLGAVAAAGIVVLFVLGIAVPSGFVAALPLMYARHRRSDG